MRPLALVGWLIVALSSFFVLAFIGELIGGSEEPGIVAGLAVFFAVVGYLGYRFAMGQLAGAAALSPEQRVLELAQRMQGRLTLAEVVLHCKMPVPQAKEVMKTLVRQGLAELHLTDGGEEVYAFSGFIPEEKASAKDPFET
jgi:hypothetical protein